MADQLHSTTELLEDNDCRAACKEEWQQQLIENLEIFDRDPDEYFPEFGELIAMSPNTLNAVLASLEDVTLPISSPQEGPMPPLGQGPRDLTSEFTKPPMKDPEFHALEKEIVLCKKTFTFAYAKLQVAREMVDKLPPMYRSACAHFLPNEPRRYETPHAALTDTRDAITRAIAALKEVKEVIVSAALNPPLQDTR